MPRIIDPIAASGASSGTVDEGRLRPRFDAGCVTHPARPITPDSKHRTQSGSNPVSPGNPTDAIALADEAEAFRRLFNEIRPHESLDFATPLSAYLAEPKVSNLFDPESVQDS